MSLTATPSLSYLPAAVPDSAAGPKVLIIHTGGTLGMDAEDPPAVAADVSPELRAGTNEHYGTLKPGHMLDKLLLVVPELNRLAGRIELRVAFNSDSSNVGPEQWVQLARLLDRERDTHDAFLVVHGTDTMAYTASAISLMLQGFGKPIVFTGSQLPLSRSRSDARQNLIDALTCAVEHWTPPGAAEAAGRAAGGGAAEAAGRAAGGGAAEAAGRAAGRGLEATSSPPRRVAFREVGLCFGGRLMRGNRARKVNSWDYQAFDSPAYPPLCCLGVEPVWNEHALLDLDAHPVPYTPRFDLDRRVLRIPIVPGTDPEFCYGDLAGRGVKGVVLEGFGVGNMPDGPTDRWLPWLKAQVEQGLVIGMISQCSLGPLRPELYHAGEAAMQLGVEAGPQMTPECACVKLMLALANEDVHMSKELAGEM